MMIRNLLMGLPPLILVIVCAVYVPGTQAKVSVLWAYLMGVLQAAVAAPALLAWIKSRKD
jgi:xanthine/uracil permease